jgi:large subunit ribosomal protein L5
MAVPKISKVVLNVGFGKMVSGKTGSESEKIQKSISDDLAQISGQRPVLTKSKKAIAGFKTRQGMILGAMVTLRGEKMYSFLERLISIAYPRSRDFQGIDVKSFDRNGNLSVAVKEQTIFPEVEADHAKLLFSFEITIATTAKNKEEGIKLLKSIGFPLRTNENNQ